MKISYKFIHEWISYAFVLALFLQGCSTLSDQIDVKEDNDFTVTVKDYILTANGGHSVTLYQKEDELRATVDENLPEGFSRQFDLPVYVSDEIALEDVARMEEKQQQRFIEVNFPKLGQPGDVCIWKRCLVGGMKPSKKTKDNIAISQSVKINSKKPEKKPKSVTEKRGKNSEQNTSNEEEIVEDEADEGWETVKNKRGKKNKPSTSSKKTKDNEVASQSMKSNNKKSENKSKSVVGSKKKKNSEESTSSKEEDEVDEGWEAKFISLTSKKSEPAKFEPYSKENYEYSDSENEEENNKPDYPGVYNLTKKGIYNIEKDQTSNPVLINGKHINNHINSNDSSEITSASYRYTLKRDADSIFQLAQNKLNQKSVDMSQITILCVALRTKNGYIKKFVFTNQPSLYQFDLNNTYYTTEEIMRVISDIAHRKRYHVIMAQRAHAEGELVQFLQERPTRYTHLVAMGCNRPHCLMCVETMNLFFYPGWCHFSGSDKAPEQYGNNWYMPIALEKVLRSSHIFEKILAKRIDINLLRRNKKETELTLDDPKWGKKSEYQQKHKTKPKDVIKMLQKGGNQKHKSSKFVLDFE